MISSLRKKYYDFIKNFGQNEKLITDKEVNIVTVSQIVQEDEIEEEDSETADTSEETPNETKEGDDSEGGVE